MINIICVLKTGGDFTSDYVVKLRNACGRHIKEEFRFICLTDDVSAKNLPGVISVCLKHNYSGWWSKFEIFRLRGKSLYFDLDTIIIDDISNFIAVVDNLKENEFAGITAFNPVRGGNEQTQFGSGVMGWNGDFEFILKNFEYNKDVKIRRMVPFFGDQERIYAILTENQIKMKFWQKETTGLYSYKRNCKNGVPKDAKIICFHGKPRPHQIDIPLTKEHWR